MDTFAQIHKVSGLNKVAVSFGEDSKAHANHHPPTLDDVQRRAFEIHHEHGAVNGGYTLDEWLEAEHELEGTDGPDSGLPRMIHDHRPSWPGPAADSLSAPGRGPRRRE